MSVLNWFESKEERWVEFESEAIPHTPDLFRMAMWLTRDRTDAEDLLQETMFQAMRSFDRYEVGTNCRAWLMRIMHNLNLKRLRKQRRMSLVDDTAEHLSETIAFEPPIPTGITDEEVLAALGEISTPYRNVIVLADVEEFSYKEISSILNVPIGTVMSRLHRARRDLRLKLAEYARNYRGEGHSQIAC